LIPEVLIVDRVDGLPAADQCYCQHTRWVGLSSAS